MREAKLCCCCLFSLVVFLFLFYLRPHFIWLKCYDLCAKRGHLEISRLSVFGNDLMCQWYAKKKKSVSRITHNVYDQWVKCSWPDERLRTQTCAIALTTLMGKGNACITSHSGVSVCACVAAQSTINSCQAVWLLAANHKKVAQLMMSRYGCRRH